MANPSATAKNATLVVPAPIGRVLKAMPGHVAVNVTSFLELVPGLPNTPANLSKMQKILKDGRPGRDGARVHKPFLFICPRTCLRGLCALASAVQPASVRGPAQSRAS